MAHRGALKADFSKCNTQQVLNKKQRGTKENGKPAQSGRVFFRLLGHIDWTQVEDQSPTERQKVQKYKALNNQREKEREQEHRLYII